MLTGDSPSQFECHCHLKYFFGPFNINIENHFSMQRGQNLLFQMDEKLEKSDIINDGCGSTQDGLTNQMMVPCCPGQGRTLFKGNRRNHFKWLSI